MDYKVLEDIGLTNAEIKVYIALLELGSSPANPVIIRTGLQSSVVHIILNRLIQKGLVSYIKEGKRNHYQATDPKHILDYLDERKERFEAVLPELIQHQGMAVGKTEVSTYRGIRGIKELLLVLLSAGGKEHHTIGSSEESLMIGKSWWVNYHKKRAEKGIKAKLLFNASLKEWAAEVKYPVVEVRFMTEGFEPLTETIIRNDKVGTIIWAENPIGVLIDHKVVAMSYEKYFQMLWERASKPLKTTNQRGIQR